MYTLAEFDAFSKKYLIHWEANSTVRTGKRSRLNKTHISEIELPFLLKPYLKYPEIQCLTQEQLQPFYLQSLCDLLYGVSQFEVSIVTDQCGKLANRDLGIELSNAIRQVAIAVGTDEMYHSFAARELLADIEELTGVIPSVLQPQSEEKSSLKSAQIQEESSPVEPREAPLDYFKNAVPLKLKHIAEAVLLCIVENAVVDDLLEMARNFQTANPAAVYNREHIQDEGRHKVFFQRLLKYIWASINEEDRILLGEAIGAYFKKYYSLGPVEQSVAMICKQLQKLPLSESALKAIASDSVASESEKPLYEKDYIKNPMQLMSFAGVTEHEPTYQLFLSLGLLSESLVAA